MIELQLYRPGKGKSTNKQELKKASKLSAQLLGNYLLGQGLTPDYVFYSECKPASSASTSALRTSAEKCCKVMGYPINEIRRVDSPFFLDEEKFMEFLLVASGNNIHSKKKVLLVADKATLKRVVLGLLKNIKCKITFARNSLLRLDVNTSGGSDSKTVCASQTSAPLHLGQLPKTFAYPTPASKEQRLRPAYYYNQSAAIPYRTGENGLEVMLVGSSGHFHKGIPKGIIDPGLSACESAEKEAWEEAGVKGKIKKKALGSFQYQKWGAQCSVEVFSLAVSEVCDEAAWLERHRGREWLSVASACELIKYKQLIPFLHQLEKTI
ncbi:phosphohistidine phosphatase [Alteromonadaceae bacterium Bs31]|nr:phosphohistidine phosphatase [Alteromonadaceae bacterium Bs31]